MGYVGPRPHFALAYDGWDTGGCLLAALVFFVCLIPLFCFYSPVYSPHPPNSAVNKERFPTLPMPWDCRISPTYTYVTRENEGDSPLLVRNPFLKVIPMYVGDLLFLIRVIRILPHCTAFSPSLQHHSTLPKAQTSAPEERQKPCVTSCSGYIIAPLINERFDVHSFSRVEEMWKGI
jgi:hypothetical protein